MSDPTPIENEFFGSWSEFFMTMAFFVGMKSKDRLTKVGAVIVSPNHQVVSVGYCGFPRGINDDIDQRHTRPSKYFYTLHAERNSVYNALYVGASVKGCWMYTPWYPCPVCAQTIIQSGISRVIHYYDRENGMGQETNVNVDLREPWAKLALESDQMFCESGVMTEKFHGKLYRDPIIQVCNGVLSPLPEEEARP